MAVCACNTGFSGDFCENDACHENLCEYGDCVIASNNTEYTCDCVDGYEGNMCGTLITTTAQEVDTTQSVLNGIICDSSTFDELLTHMNVKNVTCDAEKLTVNFSDQFYQSPCLEGRYFTGDVKNTILPKSSYYMKTLIFSEIFHIFVPLSEQRT